MSRFLSILLLIPMLSLAQQPVRIDSLPPQGFLLDQGWKWHAGDNPAWASPTFDDSRWVSIDPTKDIMDLPEVRRASVGWFRVRLALASSVRTESLALLVEQTGASEIYLNGRLLRQFGQIRKDERPTLAYDPRAIPVSFPVRTDSMLTLAIRFAFVNDLPYTVSFARHNMNPLLRIKLSGVTNAVRYDEFIRQGNLPLDYVKAGIYFFLALLHLALYRYYPVQRANAYFFGYALCCLLTYILQIQSIDIHVVETLQQTRIAIGFCTTLTHLLQLRALYSLFNRPLGGPYWFLTAFFLLCIPLMVWPYRTGMNLGHTLFYLLCAMEKFRVTVLAVRHKKRGATLILWAVVIALVSNLIYFALLPYSAGFREQYFLTNSVWYLALIHLPYNLNDQAVPIAMSLYLGLQFAFTSRTLETKLTEVETLSAQMRAQEAEKLALIAGQNEQLEQTVHERTEQLRQQADKLREMDAVKSHFFTNITHEFRTPLTLILGPAEQIREQTAEPRTRQQVALIQRNGGRLLRLINQLLDLSKLEAGKLELTKTPGDLVGLVKGTLQSFESLAHQKGIELGFTTSSERLVMTFDRDALEKILYNLLSNALKFTPSGGTVQVSLEVNDQNSTSVTLAISDTGIGIPATKLPYVYDRFYQADASDTREGEGTGIGLALTKELVELHGGTIHIDSAEGVGTSATVRLPTPVETGRNAASPPVWQYLTSPDRMAPTRMVLADASIADAQETQGIASLHIPNESPFILLIEDNDDVRAFIRSSLNGQYQILEAPNGEEGVRLAQQQVPDLVITDLMMPKMNGYQVCATLKHDERTSHIPVVMLTARADLDSKLEGLETGADAYLAKPFSQRELLAQIANLITLRRQLREHYSQVSLKPENHGQADHPKLPSMERVFLDRVRAAIDEHLADEQFSIDRLSDEMGLSRTQLHRKLKALINQSPGDLIRLIRLQRAHDLLRANVGTVSEVAYQVGFGNPANFSTSFSRQFGYAPSEVKGRT